MPEEREAIHDPNEKCEESWMQYLAEFKEKTLPVFAVYGITMGEALLVWELSRVRDELQALREDTAI